MAAGSVTLRLSNGQTMSIYLAAGQAVGTSPTVNMEGTAASTNDTDFSVKSPARIIDQLAATSTAGQMEVYNVTQSRRTGKFIDQIAANYAVTVPQRSIPAITFMPGNTYRFIQTVLQA